MLWLFIWKVQFFKHNYNACHNNMVIVQAIILPFYIHLSSHFQIYSVDEDEKLTPSLEIILPRDLADGFVNNKRESYRFK